MTEDALLAAIAERPDDDAPRLVYADWLVERGDPRGEFIQLQIGGGATEREREILREHQTAFLGPLAACVEDPAWERGFLVACRVLVDEQARRTIGHPLWSTVRRLDLRGGVELALHPVMRSLRELYGHIHDQDLVAIARAPAPLPIESLSASEPEGVRPAEFLELAALPSLKVLRIDASDRDPDWWLGGRIGHQLETVAISLPTTEIPPVRIWLDRLERSTTISRLFAPRMVFGREPDGWSIDLDLQPYFLRMALLAFADLPATRVRKLTIDARRLAPWQRLDLGQAFARFSPVMR